MCRFHFWSQFCHISPSDGTKTASGSQKWKHVSERYLKNAGSYGFLVADLESTWKVTSIGMFFRKITHFYGELGTKSCFWPKSCFCCSRTACNGSEKTKLAVGLEMFESPPRYLESCFFFDPMWATPFVKIGRFFMATILGFWTISGNNVRFRPLKTCSFNSLSHIPNAFFGVTEFRKSIP